MFVLVITLPIWHRSIFWPIALLKNCAYLFYVSLSKSKHFDSVLNKYITEHVIWKIQLWRPKFWCYENVRTFSEKSTNLCPIKNMSYFFRYSFGNFFSPSIRPTTVLEVIGAAWLFSPLLLTTEQADQFN